MRLLFSALVLIVLISCNSLGVNAQVSGADPAYIRLYPNTYTVRALLSEKISTFHLEDRKLDQKINYYPNNVLSVGLGTTIRGIGINVTTAIPFVDKMEEKYGRTKRYDVQVHRYRRKLAMDLYIQRYKGFHLNENDMVVSVNPPLPLTYFPEMRTYNIGVSAMYVFNGDRYTMKPFVDQQEWQIKSSGSFLLGGSLFGHRVTNNRDLITPPDYRYPTFYNATELNEINNYGLTVSGGYGYTFVLNKHWFAHASADIGAGPGYSIVRDLYGQRFEGFSLNVRTNARAALGYNSNLWYAGAYVVYNTDRYGMPFEQSRFTSNQGVYRIIVAKRFSHKKKADKM